MKTFDEKTNFVTVYGANAAPCHNGSTVEVGRHYVITINNQGAWEAQAKRLVVYSVDVFGILGAQHNLGAVPV